jgi:hypothetical protein
LKFSDAQQKSIDDIGGWLDPWLSGSGVECLFKALTRFSDGSDTTGRKLERQRWRH